MDAGVTDFTSTFLNWRKDYGSSEKYCYHTYFINHKVSIKLIIAEFMNICI